MMAEHLTSLVHEASVEYCFGFSFPHNNLIEVLLPFWSNTILSQRMRIKCLKKDFKKLVELLDQTCFQLILKQIFFSGSLDCSEGVKIGKCCCDVSYKTTF